MKNINVFAVLAPVLCIALTGCGKGVSDRPALIPVTGTVMLNGAPVAGADVAFFGPSAPRAATGITNAEGKFTLSMFDAGDGVLAGENVITVTKMEGSAVPAAAAPAGPPNPLDLAKMTQNRVDGKETGPKYIVPKIYSDRTTTPLKESMSAENSTLVLQLKE